MSFNKAIQSKIVHVIAPASGFSQSKLQAGVQTLEEWGFDVRVPKSLQGTHPYLAHSDSVRFDQLKQALSHADPGIIWTVRGGYGCARLMDQLSRLKKPKVEKTLIGFSDVTWLLHFVNSQWGWKSIHAPFVAELAGTGISASTKSNLKQLVQGKKDKIQFRGLKAFNTAAEKTKSLSGQIVGGNLKIIESTLGTKFSFSSRSKIVFFEDVGERGYALDRCLVHLKQAGAFRGSRAIVFGEFLGGNEVSGKNYVQRSLKEFSASVSIPVFKGLKSGHGKHNIPIVVGAKATLKAGANPVLEYKI